MAGAHEDAVRVCNEVLSKKEPIASNVLCWGWLLKQGEGGIMHGESFKNRWFVLARVPHATVLIYYDRKCMDEDHILGYIDMRRVSAVKEGNKTVSVDSSRNPMASLLHKMRGLMGASTLDSASRPVIELVTQTRTYTLCPAYVELPQPVTAAAASAPSIYGKPLYLFGWPFPVPHLEGAVMMSSEEDGTEDEHTMELSRLDAEAAVRKLLDSEKDPQCVRVGLRGAQRAGACACPPSPSHPPPPRTTTHCTPPPPPLLPTGGGQPPLALPLQQCAQDGEGHAPVPRDSPGGLHGHPAAAPAAARHGAGDRPGEH